MVGKAATIRRAAAGALMTALAGCGAPDRQNFDLHAVAARAHHARASIAIDPPTAAIPLDGESVIVREADSFSTLKGAQWAAALPELVQDRLTQTFQNAGLAGRLRAPGEEAGQRLKLDIRRFDIDVAARQARVEISAALARDGGSVAASRLFSASESVGEIAGAEPPQALDRALGRILPQIVAWAAAGR